MPARQQSIAGLMCGVCDTVLDENYDSYVEHSVCDECVGENLVWCIGCDTNLVNYDTRLNDRNGNRIDWPVDDRHVHAIYTNDGDWMCPNCVSSCENCGELYSDWDNASMCCESEESEDGPIMYYSFRPPIKFWYENEGVLKWKTMSGYGTLFMGLELEVEKASDFARDFLSDAGEHDMYAPRFVYLKHDGSLSYGGMEIVTQPATFGAFERRFPWRALENLHDAGARAWFRENCGMHIHMSRAAFSPAHMWKFLKFHSDNAEFLPRYAGRLSHWGSFENGQMKEISKTPSKYVGGPSRMDYELPRDRYSAVNITNRDTIELRYFRSNITREGVLRNLELAQSIYDYTKQVTAFDVIRGYAFNIARWFDFVVDNHYGYVESYIRREGLL